MAMHSRTIASMRSMVTSLVFPGAYFPIYLEFTHSDADTSGQVRLGDDSA
jgi:hypothetical protein